MRAGRRVAAALVVGVGLVWVAYPAEAQDTVRVEASGPPAWGQEPRLVEEVRIGRLDGEGPYLLGSIGAVAPGPDGSVFVVDRQVPIVRRYSQDGEHLGDVGRAGSGPGEYRSVLGLRSLPDGRLALWDPGNGRINVYEPTGRFSHGINVPSGLYTSDPFQVDTAGTFYVKAPDPGGAIGSGGSSTVWLRISPEGSVLGSVPIPPERTEGPAFVINSAEGVRRPFPTSTVSSLGPDGSLVTGRNDEYAFHRPLPDGRVLRVARAPEAVSIPRDERRQWEAWINFFSQGTGERFGALPRTKPAFRDLWTDQDGRIWLDRYVGARYREPVRPAPSGPGPEAPPPFRWREPATFDVFEPDGTFLGTLEFPWGIIPRAARGNQVWVVSRGDFGEQYVVRFRIIPDR